MKLSDAKDPDEYIRKFGADRFRLQLSDSENQFDYRCNTVLASHNLEDFNDRMAAVAELTALLGTLHTEVERDVYASRYAEKLNVRPESLKNDANRTFRKTEKNEEKKIIDSQIRMRQGYGDRINPDRAKNIRAANAEEAILGILLLYPEYVAQIADGFGNDILLREDEFFTAFGKRIYAAVVEAVKQYGSADMGLFGEQFDEEEMGRITGMLVARQSLTKNDTEVLRESIRVLREETDTSAEGDFSREMDSILAVKRKQKNQS